MKTKINLKLPSVDEITAGLALEDVHPELTAAEEALEKAEQDLRRARERLQDAADAAEALPAKIRAGDARPLDLEDALLKRRAASLALPAAETAVEDARGRLQDARRHAQGALRAEVEVRVGRLQSTVDDLAPFLEQIRELETAVINAAWEAAGVDDLGRPVKPDPTPTRWPRSRAHELAHRSAAAGMRAANRRTASTG